MPRRIVIDTNVFVSRLLRGASTPGQAVDKALLSATVLFSTATWTELRIVPLRPKFSRYIRPGDFELFLNTLRELAEMIEIESPIRACRDPRDDKFLEAAVYGRAEAIVTGDEDLLALHPFRGIAILTGADYLLRG